MSDLIHIDAEYKHWIADLSLRYRKTQIKMAMKVNDEMLRFYWSLGKDMPDMHIEERWGYISRFYRLHSQSIVNYPQVEGELLPYAQIPPDHPICSLPDYNSMFRTRYGKYSSLSWSFHQ